MSYIDEQLKRFKKMIEDAIIEGGAEGKYDILNYYYRNVILSLKNGATLDDLKLSTKYWTWYFNSIIMPTVSFNSNVIPITFDEFLNNRSLSRYIQKASKEINYEISNRNKNNN